jgi:hypothetical protein
MNLNADELAALESGMYRIGIFFRLDVTPPVRLWLGVGAIEPGVNAYDDDGATYYGFGELAEVPAFNQMINGRAARVDFILSGVSGRLLQIASGGDAEQVKGKAVVTGFAMFAPDWLNLLGPIKWCANYVADYLALEQGVPDGPDIPITRTIRLSCGSLMTGRRRPGLSWFTDQDQRARFPGDRFCERTPLYATGFNKAWPTFPDP